MSGEDVLWRYMKEHLGFIARLTRIENSCGTGTPDIAYTLRKLPIVLGSQGAVTGWIELKHISAWPVRPDTMVSVPSLKLDQVNWLEDERKAGGRAWCLLQAGRDYLLLNEVATRALFEKRMRTRNLLQAATITWQAGSFPLSQICASLYGN